MYVYIIEFRLFASFSTAQYSTIDICSELLAVRLEHIPQSLVIVSAILNFV